MPSGRRWLIDVQLAGDALIVSAFIYFTGGDHQLLRRCCTCCRSSRPARCSSGAAVLLVATLEPVAVCPASCWRSISPRPAGCSVTHLSDYAAIVAVRASFARYTVALNVFGFFAVALLSGSLADEPAVGRRPARTGVDADRRPAGAQSARDRQPAERPRRPPITQQRILTFNRAAEAITGVPFASAVRTADRRRAAAAGRHASDARRPICAGGGAAAS